MKIVSIVLNDFRNDNRVVKFCQSLKSAGHHVEVAALHRPGLDMEGEQHGIPFRRIALKSYKLSYAWSPLKFAEFAMKLRRKYKNFDIWIANDFEPLVAYSFARKTGLRSKLMYDCHEFQSHIEGVKSVRKRNFIQSMERRILSSQTPVFQVSPGILQAYSELYGLKNQYLLLNLPKRAENNISGHYFRSKWGISDDATIFLYQGKLSKKRGLENIIQAFRELDQSNFHFVAMGFGNLKEKIENLSKEYSNIHYHKAVPMDQLMAYTSSADWGITNLQDTCLNHYHSMPNKLFEYLQAGIPVLSSNMIDTRNFIEEHGLGRIMEKSDVPSIKEAITAAATMDRAAIKQRVNKIGSEYIWENQEFKIFEAIESLNLR